MQTFTHSKGVGVCNRTSLPQTPTNGTLAICRDTRNRIHRCAGMTLADGVIIGFHYLRLQDHPKPPMIKRSTLCILLFLTLPLLSAQSPQYKTLDLRYFTIDVPLKWKYIPAQGIDSFVGQIKGNGVKLSFDCSTMGYASSLVETPDDYVKRKISTFHSMRFNKPGVTYTHAKHVKAVKIDQMKQLNTTDSSAVNVEPYIRPKTRIYTPTDADHEKYKDADYLVDLTHNDSTITVGITLPDDIRKHNFRIDTLGEFIVKTIWPQKTGDGITGVYYRKLNSNFDLQLNGRNLKADTQEKVLTAFKSIRIKN